VKYLFELLEHGEVPTAGGEVQGRVVGPRVGRHQGSRPEQQLDLFDNGRIVQECQCGGETREREKERVNVREIRTRKVVSWDGAEVADAEARKGDGDKSKFHRV